MNLYYFIGGFGLFYFVFRLMIEYLAQSGENLVRDFLGRFKPTILSLTLVGTLVTTLVQSSRTATLMAMGLVNAGLLSLTLAIAFILGANVGATTTVWLFSLANLKLALVLVGVGTLPKIATRRLFLHLIGQTILGLGLIYLGLHFMQPLLTDLTANPIFQESMAPLHEVSALSILYCLLIGILLSLIVESSNFVIGLIMLGFWNKLLLLSTATAMVLGANLGAALLALIAAISGNPSSKKAALSHIVFNFTGVLIACLFFKPLLSFLDDFNPLMVIPLTHTLFNLTTALLFLPFIHYLVIFLNRLFPNLEEKEAHHLVLLGGAQDVMPATAIIMAEIEIKKFHDVVTRQHKLTRDYLVLEEKNQSTYDKIKHYENITDNMQKEITLFLGKVMERALTQKQSTQTRSLIRMADEMESVSDYLERLAFYKTRFDQSFSLKGEVAIEFFQFYDQMIELYQHSTLGFADADVNNIKTTEAKAEELKIVADDMRDQHLKRISNGEYSPLSSLTYSDMVVAVRKIRLNAVHLSRCIRDYNQSKA